MAEDMNDKDLIGYCRIHCQTERALFVGRHVNRMLVLAGNNVDKVEDDQWYSLKENMAALCDLAEIRLRGEKEPAKLSVIERDTKEEGYHMVMEFLDPDEKYVYGFEAGKIWGKCEARQWPDHQLVHICNKNQLALIAEHFKCDVFFDDVAPEWCQVTFAPRANLGQPKLRVVKNDAQKDE